MARNTHLCQMSIRIFHVLQHVIGDARVERMIREGILVIFNPVGRTECRVGVNVWININAMQFADLAQKVRRAVTGPRANFQNF